MLQRQCAVATAVASHCMQHQVSYQLVMLPLDQQPPDHIMPHSDEQKYYMPANWLPSPDINVNCAYTYIQLVLASYLIMSLASMLSPWCTAVRK